MGPEPDHPVAEIDRLLEIVCDEKDGHARAARDFEHLVLQGLAGHRVERPEWLVHHHRRRLLRKAACDLQPLLHPTRHLRRVLVGEGAEPNSPEERRDPVAALIARRSHGFERKRDVARGGAPGQQRPGIVLEDDRDVAARAFDTCAGEVDLAARRPDQAGGDPEGGRLAAAGWTHNAHDLAALDG